MNQIATPDRRLHPRFISLEGGEGAGKTTALAAIEKVLSQRGEVVVTREPGGTGMAERIRNLLLDAGDETLTSHSELLLMFAARSQLVANVIQPALQRGAFVVSSRFVDSSYAYQGAARGLDMALIHALDQATVSVMPNLTFLLDLDVHTGRQRIEARGEALDRIELEEAAFFERVREGYRRRAMAAPERFVTIDAAMNPAAVVEAIEQTLHQRLGPVPAHSS
ncbi:MAG: dTMP kinase [Pseudomonas sp.]